MKLHILVPIILTAYVLFGTIIYAHLNKWELSTAYFYTAQNLVGCNYGVPDHVEGYYGTGWIFALFFYIFGTTHIVGSVLSLYGEIYTNNTSPPLEKNMTAIIMALCWLIVGVCYGRGYEHMDLHESFFFAIAAMTANGSPPPPCPKIDGTDTCQLGTFRGFFMGSFVLIGVPLYVFAMSNFVGILLILGRNESSEELIPKVLVFGSSKIWHSLSNENLAALVDKSSSENLAALVDKSSSENLAALVDNPVVENIFNETKNETSVANEGEHIHPLGESRSDALFNDDSNSEDEHTSPSQSQFSIPISTGLRRSSRLGRNENLKGTL